MGRTADPVWPLASGRAYVVGRGEQAYPQQPAVAGDREDHRHDEEELQLTWEGQPEKVALAS